MDKLVYLTADAADELHELDAESIYIIGGLVDRNRYKNICQNKATEQVCWPGTAAQSGPDCWGRQDMAMNLSA